MEKVVLSKGYEFELVPNAVANGNNSITVTFLPNEGDTAELLNQEWAGNDLISIKVDDAAIRNFRGFVNVDSVSMINDYVIGEETVGEEGEEELHEIKATVFAVTVSMPDLASQVANNTDAIEDIINTILG